MGKTVGVALVAGIIGFFVSWILFVEIYRPTDSDFLRTTTSKYFREMSERGHNNIASFSDCRLEAGDDMDRRQGHLMFGICSAESETHSVYFMVAMTPTAQIAYTDWEERNMGQ